MFLFISCLHLSLHLVTSRMAFFGVEYSLTFSREQAQKLDVSSPSADICILFIETDIPSMIFVCMNM